MSAHLFTRKVLGNLPGFNFSIVLFGLQLENEYEFELKSALTNI